MTNSETPKFENLLAKGKEAAKRGNFQEAIASLQAAQEIGPPDSRPIIAKATIYEKIGEFNSAAIEIDRQLKLTPDDIDLLAQRARIALNLSDNETAGRVLERAVKLQPELSSLWIAYISVLANSVSAVQATYLIENLGIDPPLEATLLIQLAVIEVAAGRFDIAERHIRQIVDQQPESIENQQLLAKFLMEIGEESEARKIYSNLHEKAPDSISILMAEAFAEQHENSTVPLAINNYERVLALDPTNTVAMRQLAECQTRLARYSSALHWMEQLAIHGESLSADDIFTQGRLQNYLNNSHAAKKLYQSADTLLQARLLKDKASAIDFSNALSKRSRIAIAQQKYDKARKLYISAKKDRDTASFQYDKNLYLDETPQRINHLRRIIRHRDVLVLAQGPSISAMSKWREQLSTIDVCLAAVSSFSVLETNILRAAGKHVNISLLTHYRGIASHFQQIQQFLKRTDDNLFITSRWAMDRLGRQLPTRQELESEFEAKLLYIEGSSGMAGPTPFNPLRFVFGNSLSTLIPLMALGGARRIFLFGADGVHANTVTPSSYFGENSPDFNFDFDNADRKALTEALRADTLDLPEAVEVGLLSLETLFNFERPPIFNVSPGSALNFFPIIDYDFAFELLSAEGTA